MRARCGTNEIKGGVDIGDPIAQRFIHRVFKGAAPGAHRYDFSAEQFHAKHIWLLALYILRAHKHYTRQVKTRTNRRCSDAMLARTGLGNDAGLAHALGEQNLAQAIIDLMRAGVVELIALKIDFRALFRACDFAHMFGQSFSKIERARATNIMLEVIVKLIAKFGVFLGGFIFLLEREDERHERLGNKPAAKNAKAAIFVRAHGIAVLCAHNGGSLCWAAPKAPIKVASGAAKFELLALTKLLAPALGGAASLIQNDSPHVRVELQRYAGHTLDRQKNAQKQPPSGHTAGAIKIFDIRRPWPL